MTRATIFLTLTMIAASCAAPPKPTELDALEKLRQQGQYLAAKRRAPDLIAEGEAALLLAVDEWQSNELEEARRDALMGQIKIKTALALVEQDQARIRISAANKEYATEYDQYMRTNKELQGMQEQIALLEKLGQARGVAEAERQKAEAERQRVEEEKRRSAEQVSGVQARANAQDKIKAAEVAIKAADAVEAKSYAKMEYASAVEAIERANAELGRGDLAAAVTSAELARMKAERASELARPQWEATGSSTASKARNEALSREASSLPGVTVRLERRGDLQRLVLVVRGLYKRKSTVMSPGNDILLDALATLLKKYPMYQVQVIGHTAKGMGRATEMVALSLAWAQGVQGAMLARGVDARRLTVSGQGADEPLSDSRSRSGREQNNRVEVIFLYQ